ncbi:RagB/SusD family nutrient uptake outer membrane protein [uncultured Eudoraea sp.]|uniref:RagB/SusD family nutrient uptake outer membrane protein n=1 Tax=uncultured Eudoraea sp. TaxID=1035614 RepID=UPI00261955B4|nr:RagB/SusD family nutrient uptake outer membrane protein [uncultured Eudoraea sp.]
MKNAQIKKYLLPAILGIAFMSCSDLEIEATDRIIDRSTAEGGIFNGVESVPASLDNIYNLLGPNLIGTGGYTGLQHITTDEQIVPTRGTDWGDNGLWRNLHAHTWDSSHAVVVFTWDTWNEIIFLTSEVIDPRSNASQEEVAQASFIRAFATWVIMDLFGQVPNRAPDEGPEINPVVLSRTEALASVLSDLDIAIEGLPSASAGDMDILKRGTKAAARFLKARVLLNSGVYNGTGIPISLDEVISLVDEIAAEGFALQSGYFDIFQESADTETVFWLPTNVGVLIYGSLHYSQGIGGWNGFSTLSEFYDIFEGDANSNAFGIGQEERRGFVPGINESNETNKGIGYGFLIGQQYNADGTKTKDRTGKDLVFTREYPGLIGVGEANGIRVLKYHPSINNGFVNHAIIFRYADAHLMKAEAILRSGGDATAMVNELRVLRGATPLGVVSENELLEERGRELYLELVRRTDMIRFAQFTRNWEFKDTNSIGDDTKNLYPIPSNALLTNPNLIQNPGY